MFGGGRLFAIQDIIIFIFFILIAGRLKKQYFRATVTMTWRKKILGLFRLFRFELPFTAGICVVMGEILALGSIPPPREMLLGFMSVFFISATALILNDYFDIETDRINAPERPLPSGLVTKQEVLFLSVVVTLSGFVTGYCISITFMIVSIPIWIIGFLYNWHFKKTGLPGNLMVGFSVGMTFIMGGIAVNKPFEPIVWFFALWVLLIDLAEEIAADVMDREGDHKTGSRSLAVVLGPEKALRISVGIFLLVVIGSSVPFILGWMELKYLSPIVMTDVVILYSGLKLTDTRIANRRKYIRWIYLSGLAALLLLIIIRLADGNNFR